MTDRIVLARTLDALLQPEKFRDYGPNGLQVEGRLQVAQDRLGCDCQPGADPGRGGPRCRRDSGAPWSVLARAGWTGDRLDEAAAGLVARARRESVCLPSAAGCASANWATTPSSGNGLDWSQDRPFRRAGPGLSGRSAPMAVSMPMRRVAGATIWRKLLQPVGDGGRCDAVARFAALPGAPVVPRAISRRPLPRVRTPSSPVRYPSRRPITRANVVSPTWPAATMPANALARGSGRSCGAPTVAGARVHRHRQPGLNKARHEANQLPSRWVIRPASARRSSPRPFAMRPALTAGCFVVGDVAILRRAARLTAGFGPRPVAGGGHRTAGRGACMCRRPAFRCCRSGPPGAPIALGRVSAAAGAIAAAVRASGRPMRRCAAILRRW